MFLSLLLENKIWRICNMRRTFKPAILLSLVALLAGCNGRAAVQKPSFYGYKNKVEFAEFSSKLDELYAGSPIFNYKEEDEVPSFKQVGTTSIHIEQSLSRKGDGKDMEFNGLTSDVSNSVHGEYDSVSKVFSYSGTQKSVSNSTYYNKERVVEAVSLKESEFLLAENDEEVVIYNENTLLATAIEGSTKGMLHGVASIIAIASLFIDTRFPTVSRWESLDDEIKARYTFYSDKTVMTASYQYSVNYQIKNDDTGLVSEKIATYTSRLLQISISETEIKYTDYIRNISYSESYTYAGTYNIIDIDDYSEIKATESTITFDDKVNVELPNITNYKKGNEVLSSLFFTSLS